MFLAKQQYFSQTQQYFIIQLTGNKFRPQDPHQVIII